ncbi:MAG: PEP-CTERM sorting domain-containing protein [Rubrivivax sp.]|nr:PEP-CTERM sorting domain-containing protein [Rubrivivax sp.]
MTLTATIRSALMSLAVVLAGPASAFYFKGDTTGSPTFDRSVADFSGMPAIGEDVAYDVFAFTVTADGVYKFGSLVSGYLQDSPAWDQYLFLYSGSFDPTAPMLNGVAGNDDFPDIGRSGFQTSLTAGTSYFLVTTGYEADDFGGYLNWIHGGTVVPGIPESSTYAMLALGLMGVAVAVRQRRGVDTLH